MKKIVLSLLCVLSIILGFKAVSAAEVSGDTIVAVNQSGGKYSIVAVDYVTSFEDSTVIKNGDTVTFTLPKELDLQASLSFDVLNVDYQTIGRAVADVSTDTVRVTFNDYFEKHPKNKTMQLHLTTKWNVDNVKSGESYNLDFNGFIVPVSIRPEKGPDVTELISKWGNQIAEEPNKVHWWTRFNYAKKELHDVVIQDTWDSNQEYVPGTMRIRVLSDINPWTEIRSIDESQVVFTENGFELRLDELSDILSIDYQVKLKDATQNPVNSVKLIASGAQLMNKTEMVQLANGSGSGGGETTTTTTEEPTTTTTTTETTTETTTTEETTEVTTQEVTTEGVTTEGTEETTSNDVVELTAEDKLPETGTASSALFIITANLLLVVAFVVSARKDGK